MIKSSIIYPQVSFCFFEKSSVCDTLRKYYTFFQYFVLWIGHVLYESTAYFHSHVVLLVACAINAWHVRVMQREGERKAQL